MKILVPVDGSPYTQRMLSYLAAHPDWLGPAHAYTVVHVVAPIPPHAASALDKATVKAYYDDEADKVFAPIREFMQRQQLPASFVSKPGHVGDVLTEMADKEGFDLIIMGSHGQSALSRLVLGSVASKVLAHGSVPVLIVR